MKKEVRAGCGLGCLGFAFSLVGCANSDPSHGGSVFIFFGIASILVFIFLIMKIKKEPYAPTTESKSELTEKTGFTVGSIEYGILRKILKTNLYKKCFLNYIILKENVL